ncbi:class I SAM-dependent methyltransferase [Candidatus Peregrinibacteria bacterium]|nr:class I SAM-dependent methyltransferase [Candidatus Peregrinibacteria bacterium]
MSKDIQYIIRDRCLITGKDTLEPLYCIKNFPVFIGCTDEEESKDLRADMDFDICTETGFIQLRKLLPLDLIYSQYHSEAVGKVWASHHEALKNFIAKHNLKKVLEIGGSNGAIAKKYVEQVNDATWTIIEPNPSFEGNKKIRMIKGFFDEKFTLDKKIDGIIHSHVLEHLYDPIEALRNIYDFLAIGGKHIFSVPNLAAWLAKKFPNTLNFEHTFFLTEAILDQLLPASGFKVLEKDYYQEHSIFYATEKIAYKQAVVFDNHYQEYKKLYLDFIDCQKKMVGDFNKQMKGFLGHVYLFGAHIFSQALLEFGLDEKRIVKILDDSTLKEGKRLYGSSLFVGNPLEIKNKENIMVIVKAGTYTDDITKRLQKLNPRAKILN